MNSPAIPQPVQFWAKTTADGRPGISVRDHCLNVGCVAEALRELLPESLKELLSTELWAALLGRIGLSGAESLKQLDHVIEVGLDHPAADMIEDIPVGYGKPIGTRHAPRCVRRVPKAATEDPNGSSSS